MQAAFQAAFDPQNPNGQNRLQQGQRVIHVYRLYRKLTAPQLGEFAPDGDLGVLDQVRQGIRTARLFLRGNILGPLQGRILEREFQMPLLIERFDRMPEVRTRLTYVQGSAKRSGPAVFVDVPFRNGRGITHFRITGKTYGTPCVVDGVPVDGDAAVLDFEQMVESYFSPDQGTTADYELWFVDLYNPRSAQDPFGAREWLIHPLTHSVRGSQQGDRPFSRFWSFEFAGLLNNKDIAKDDGLFSSLFGLSTLKGLVNALLGAVGLDGWGDYFFGVIEDVFGVVDELVGLIEDVNAVVVAISDVIEGVQQFITLTIAKARSVVLALDELRGRIEAAIDLAENLGSLTAQQWNLLTADARGLVNGPEGGYVALQQVCAARDLVLAALANIPLWQPPASVTARQVPTIPRQVPLNITLEELARQANVPVAQLVETNGLKFPFVDARERPERRVARIRQEKDAAGAVGNLELVARLDARLAEAEAEAVTRPAVDGVRYAGEFIRIPVERSAQPAVTSPAEQQIVALTGQPVTVEEELFGIDIASDSDGNLLFDEAGDFVLRRGLDNIAAAQVRYVRLPLGRLRFAPGIGNYAYESVGKWQSREVGRLLAYSLYKTLSQDVRVEQVSNVRASLEGGAAVVTYDAVLIAQRRLPAQSAPLTAYQDTF